MLFRDLEREEQMVPYGNKVYRIKPKNAGGCYFEIIQEPLGNCQVCTISWMVYFMLGSENASDFANNLKLVYELTAKKLVLIDLVSTQLNRLEELIKESNGHLDGIINFKQSYTSTNYSHMTLVQINLTKIL